jgi:acyl-[acyl-carrier-protein]-phospholipid O-acyltransferase/long-chain-fatty-acid--[acyl-carrier-protein] ligase
MRLSISRGRSLRKIFARRITDDCPRCKRSLIRLLLRLLLRVRIVGDDSPFYRTGPLLIICNHRWIFDALVLALFLPRNPVAIISPEEAGMRPVRWLLSSVRHVVLDIANPRSGKRIVRMLRTGQPVILFPEARIVDGAAVMKIYPVSSLVAFKVGANVLPVQVERSGRGWPVTTLRLFPPRRTDDELSGDARENRLAGVRRLTAVMQRANVEAVAYKPLYECFLDAVAKHGRRVRIIEDHADQPHTYGDVLRLSLAMSRILRRCTMDHETVGVFLPNVIATVAVVLGLSAAGRVPAMLNYSDGPQGVEGARIAADLRTVITSRRFVERPQFQPMQDVLNRCRLVFLEDERDRFGLLDRFWLLGFAMWMPRRIAARQSTRDAAVVLFTSGSEGRAKGVVLSHHSIVANVAQMRAVFDFSPVDKVLNPLPLYHAYSFTAGMILPLITGTRVNLFISPLRYRAVAETAYRRDCTILLGTSTFLSFYARHATPVDFSRMRHVISGGEKLSPDVARIWMDKFGVRIMEGYGSTECGPVIALSTTAAFRRGAVGRFLPGMDYRIEPIQGIDQGGALHVRGPNLMLGYYTNQNPGVVEATQSPFGEGWYDTGDVAEVDQDGFVFIVGRIKRFAKIAGEMVSLDLVEHVAREASPEFHHAAVLGMQTHDGETTLLFTTDSTLTRSRLLETAKSLGMRELHVARRLKKVRELPLLASGKIDYGTLKTLIERDAIRPLPDAPVS